MVQIHLWTPSDLIKSENIHYIIAARYILFILEAVKVRVWYPAIGNALPIKIHGR